MRWCCRTVIMTIFRRINPGTERHNLPSALKVIAHPHIFEPRRAALWLGSYPLKFKRLSPLFCEETLRRDYQFVLTEKPYSISSRFLFAGEITQRAVVRRYGYCSVTVRQDYVRDDSFLIWRGEEGCDYHRMRNFIQALESVYNMRVP